MSAGHTAEASVQTIWVTPAKPIVRAVSNPENTIREGEILAVALSFKHLELDVYLFDRRTGLFEAKDFKPATPPTPT